MYFSIIKYIFLFHLIWIAVEDIRFRKIDTFQLLLNSILGIFLGLSESQIFQMLQNLIFNGLILIAIIAPVYYYSIRVHKSKKEQIFGIADYWILINMSIFSEPKVFLVIICLSFIFAFIYGVLSIIKNILKKEQINLQIQIPMIPFFTLGYFMTIFVNFYQTKI